MLPFDENETPVRRFLRAALAPLHFVVAAFGRFAWACEHGIAFALGVLLSASERVDRFGDIVGLAWRILLWPLHAMRLLHQWVWGRLTPPALRSVLATQFLRLHDFSHWLLDKSVIVAEKLALDRFVWILIWALQPIWRPIAALMGFIVAWAQSREYLAVVRAIPALLIVVPLGAAISHGLVYGHSKTAETYRRAARDAREANDHEMLLFYERKLSQLNVKNDAAEFRMALGFVDQDDMQSALQRMRVLAPDDAPGYAPAHLWLIRQLAAGELELSREESLRQLRIHLDHVRALEVKDDYLSLIEAGWFIETGDMSAAAQTLQPLVDEHRAAAVQLLLIEVELQHLEQARLHAQTLRKHMLLAVEQASSLSSLDYQAWALAEQLLGNPDRLREVVEIWCEQYPDDAEARSRLAALVHDEFQRILQSAAQSEKGLLGEVSRPDVSLLVERFLQTYELASSASEQLNIQLRRFCLNSGNSDLAKDFILALGADPRTPSVFLETIGSHSIQQGDWNRGTQLLRKAVELDPQHALAWNNLAWVLANGANPELEEALSASNQALRLAGDVARFRETRGQIFVQLQRWSDAVADLEVAANGMPESADVHRSLAEAYQAMGNEELAQIHREYLK